MRTVYLGRGARGGGEEQSGAKKVLERKLEEKKSLPKLNFSPNTHFLSVAPESRAFPQLLFLSHAKSKVF